MHLYKIIYTLFTFIAAPNPNPAPKPTHHNTTKANTSAVTGIYLQKLTINKQYKNSTNKLCCIPCLSEAIWSLIAKERVKHKVLIAENESCSINALTYLSKRYSRSVAWHNWSRDHTRANSLFTTAWCIDHRPDKSHGISQPKLT